MNFEVEVKYRAVDHDQLVQRLSQIGAVAGAVVDHVDIYFNHPVRDFGRSNEAFRIRRLGEENRITYKGPRRIGPTKTREEIEIAVAPGVDEFNRLRKLLENLGFCPVATVRKRRESFHLSFQKHELEIALDSAEGLGPFAEIETIAGSEADLPAAQQAVIALAGSLGLTEVEPRSYLRMVLENQAATR